MLRARKAIMRCVTFYIGVLLNFGFLFATDPQIDYVSRRIEAHFTIQDEESAYEEALQAIRHYPHSDLLLASYIRATARLGLEKEMLEAWKSYSAQFSHLPLNRKLIEEMAWGVLQKAANSSSLVMRQMSLIAALLSQDIKGVHILHAGLEDSNYAIRSIATELAGHLPDAKLVQRIKTLFYTEKAWIVRQKVIAAVGSMKIHEMKPDLKALIISDESLAEERALAITALIDLLDDLEREDVVNLTQSNRAGLRLLACEAITHFRSERDLDQLLVLSQDFNSDVRLAALQAIGLLRPEADSQKILKIVREKTNDPNYKVAITAAWLLTLYVPDEGMHYIAQQLNNPLRERRILAAAALHATGQYGVPLSLQNFDTHADPYVRLNLALHLAGQRIACSSVCRVIEEMMEKDKAQWCQIDSGIFECIATRQIFREIESESTPEMEDQLKRLEILNLLAILKSPNAQHAIRKFLNERSWGISGAAATLLLTEGDELAINLVEELLEDPNPKIRLQAALVLSIWSEDESAIQILEQNYQGNSHEQKCRILEAIARIGSVKSVPFLINILHESSQTLRLIAALGLIQCLNN